MLKNPRKNFGIVPASPGIGFTLSVFFIIFYLVLPLIANTANYLLGDTVTPSEGFGNGVRLGILFMLIWTVQLSKGRIQEAYIVYKRVRYIKKDLMPFLRYKYNVELDRSLDNALNIIGDGPLSVRGMGPQETLRFMGWEDIEKAAQGEGLLSPLGDSVYLVLQMADLSRKELAVTGKDNDEREIFRPVEEPLPLEEIEEGIQTMISSIIHGLPAGESSLKCLSAGNSEIEGVEGDFIVRTDIDGSVSYSLEKYNSLVEAALFNVRMTGNSMIVSVAQTHSDKTFICAQIIKDNGYIEVPPSDLKRITQSEETEGFVFVKNVKEMR